MGIKLKLGGENICLVWEPCKSIWVSNCCIFPDMRERVWEPCKSIWVSNAGTLVNRLLVVWEPCKSIWVSNWRDLPVRHMDVWEPCKSIWVSNQFQQNNGENKVWRGAMDPQEKIIYVNRRRNFIRFSWRSPFFSDIGYNINAVWQCIFVEEEKTAVHVSPCNRELTK